MNHRLKLVGPIVQASRLDNIV